MNHRHNDPREDREPHSDWQHSVDQINENHSTPHSIANRPRVTVQCDKNRDSADKSQDDIGNDDHLLLVKGALVTHYL